MLYNCTRRSMSVPAALLRRGRVLEVPLYYLLSTSDLAREGFENGGSYRFADHIYCDEASGRGRFGRWLDRRILAVPAVRSFRNRYLHTRAACFRFLMKHGDSGRDLDILSVPSGIPRELIEAACRFRRQGGSLDKIRLHALDLDPEVLDAAQALAKANGIPLSVHQGDVFDASAYGGEFDFATSTGLGEFLDDVQLEAFFRILFEHLRPGGVLVASATGRRWFSDYLLRLAELKIHYRGRGELAELARRIPFSCMEINQDELGIQSFLWARK